MYNLKVVWTIWSSFYGFCWKKTYRLIIYHWTSKILPVISKRHIVGGGGDRDGETSLNYLSTCPIHQLQLHKIHEIMLF